MFRSPTLLVVGAGASCEYGLPSGPDLNERIRKALPRLFHESGQAVEVPDHLAWTQISEHHKERGTLQILSSAALDLARQIRNTESIDEAIGHWRNRAEIVLLGKSLIAKTILEAERQSRIDKRIQDDWNPAIPFENQSWLRGFFRLAQEGLSREQFSHMFSNVTVINFNYDRVIEQYLFATLTGQFDFTKSETAEIISALKIIRPYGKINDLSWQNEERTGTDFGAVDLADFIELSRGLLTLSDQTSSPEMQASIDAAINSSQLILVLGFGYARSNVSLLGPHQNQRLMLDRLGLSTVYKIPGPDQASVTRTLNDQLACTSAELFDGTAARLFQDKQRSIASRVG